MSSNADLRATAAPVSQSERIIILDSLRGIAILGILLMNIPGYGFAKLLSIDPGILNEVGLNYKVWYYIELIPEGTQRALFAMLFGAGVVLFISRQEKRLEGIKPAEYFFRRQLWLLVFGLIHGFLLLWYWEVLFLYAIAGMVLFAFYRLSPKSLIICSATCFLVMFTVNQRFLYKDKAIIIKGEQISKLDTSRTKLTNVQKEELQEMNDFKERTSLESKLKQVEKENAAVLGSYSQLYEDRADKTIESETEGVYYDIWDALMFMFLGMAFYKNGVLLGKARLSTYLLFFLIGFGIGIPLSYLRVQILVENNFNRFDVVKDTTIALYDVSRLFRAFGFLGLIMLMYKSGRFKRVFSLFRPVGQMAFTNYLLQSIIALVFFYGIGFGYFGKLQRYELYIYVMAVWVFQIILSHIWLRYFRFGPFEWLWRSLTYWKLQPFRREKSSNQSELSIA